MAWSCATPRAMGGVRRGLSVVVGGISAGIPNTMPAVMSRFCTMTTSSRPAFCGLVAAHPARDCDAHRQVLSGASSGSGEAGAGRTLRSKLRHEYRAQEHQQEVRRLSLRLTISACIIETGELVALLGLSGFGPRPTLLRIIAGTRDAPDTGEVLFHGEEREAPSGQRPQAQGSVSCFQHYALFRHMTVFENVAFGNARAAAARTPRRGRDRAAPCMTC